MTVPPFTGTDGLEGNRPFRGVTFSGVGPLPLQELVSSQSQEALPKEVVPLGPPGVCSGHLGVQLPGCARDGLRATPSRSFTAAPAPAPQAVTMGDPVSAPKKGPSAR